MNKTVYFGSYPQNLVTDSSIISSLGGFDNSWKSYNYILGTFEEKKAPIFDNYMFYTDKTYNGKKYRGVYFTKYRSHTPIVPSYSSASCQPKNGFFINTVYWFEYSPILWNILTNKDGEDLLLTNKVLDSQEFYFYADSIKREREDYQGKKSEVYDNNYQFSHIRKWLNTTFYDTAFNLEEKSKILLTEQDNSIKSTGLETNNYVCENTKDKVFLLSVEEVNNYLPNLDERIKEGTDYAKCQNLWITNKGYCGFWWLRSPYQLYSSSVKNIYYNGKFESCGAFGSNTGVAPAIIIK